MRRGFDAVKLRARAPRRAAVAGALLALGLHASAAEPAPACAKPVYLTIDTGHMGVAQLVAEVLDRHHVKATFFLANEKTLNGGTSLDDEWAPWWKARAAEGHLFGSHTYDHVYWAGDLQGEPPSFRVRPSAGPQAGRTQTYSAAQYCEEIERSAQRFRQMTGQAMAPIFRAPGGKTSPRLLAAAKACGWTHVGWSPAGFLGDELPSERYSNKALLEQALRRIRAGDVLLMHLGIWSRKDPWAPADLEPLVEGLQARGFCFETLRTHPLYRAALAASGPQRR